MKVWSMVTIAVVIGVVGLGVGSSEDSKPATADTLRQLEGEFMKAAAEKGSAGYMSYYAENAVEVPNGEDAIQGKANIAKTMGFLDDKKNQLVWTPVGADISASGISGIRGGRTSFGRRTRMESRLSSTASTPASGRSRAMEAGKWCSIWGMQVRRPKRIRAPHRDPGNQPGTIHPQRRSRVPSR
jgi:hypothetical protein